MKTVKITNAEWLEREEQIYSAIENFAKKIHIDGIHISTYASYVRYFAVWQGGDVHEFWCVFNDKEEVVGFGHWYVMGPPHIQKVYCQSLYAWSQGPKEKHEAIQMLMEEYIKFGKKNKAIWYSSDFINRQVASTVIKYADRLGYDARETGMINVIMRRKPE